LATPERLVYVPKVLLPLAVLPLVRPGWLLPAAPILAMNLISEWPTTTSLEVHYLTPALPFLAAGALEGASRLFSRRMGLALAALTGAALIGHVVAGGTPLSIGFASDVFRPDADTIAAR